MRQANSSQHTSVDIIRIDFMDAYSAIHQQASESEKKSKARKRFEARRAIEEHQEKKRLREMLSDWWNDLEH